ncbi:MAG TPA: hypothetical protein VLZ54_05160 [Arenibacter sp.]|nr:hypothetical protein [Arenibacter sp.]
MILKKEVFRADKKTNPVIGILLFLISVLLFVVTVPLGFIYGLLYGLFKKGMTGMGEFLLKIAISIDQLGNVAMQHLLNLLWIKKDGYKFGNRDETISSALGKNNRLGTLTLFGKFIDAFLDLIDKGHSLNSIDYYVEPSLEILDVLTWVQVMDQKILTLRRTGQGKYNIPGGIKEKGEPDALGLYRILKEELKIGLDLPSLRYIGIFEARAAGQAPNIIDRKTCYSAAYLDIFSPNTDVVEIVWLNYRDREKVSEVDKLIFDFLKDSGQLA